MARTVSSFLKTMCPVVMRSEHGDKVFALVLQSDCSIHHQPLCPAYPQVWMDKLGAKANRVNQQEVND